MKEVYLAIVVASALFLCAARNGSGTTPSNQPHANQIEKTASDKRTTATPTATISTQGGPTPTSAQSAAYTYNYYYPAPESWLTFVGQIATIVSALFLTGFTGGLLWTSIKQWRVIDRQANALDKTLLATGKAADAANDSAQTAQLTLEIANRAKVSMRATIGPTELSYELRNSGQMPATEVTTSIFRNQFDMENTFQTPPPKWQGNVIAQGEPLKREVPLFTGAPHPDATPILTADDIARAKAREYPINIIIYTTYNDGFGKPRVTWRRFDFDPEQGTWYPMGARQD